VGAHEAERRIGAIDDGEDPRDQGAAAFEIAAGRDGVPRISFHNGVEAARIEALACRLDGVERRR
jgi:hypothetical protein